MPSFGTKLSDNDVGTILDFFKARWGDNERAFQQQVSEHQPGSDG